MEVSQAGAHFFRYILFFRKKNAHNKNDTNSVGGARKKVVEELQKSPKNSNSVMYVHTYWMQSSSNVKFVISHEIIKTGLSNALKSYLGIVKVKPMLQENENN